MSMLSKKNKVAESSHLKPCAGSSLVERTMTTDSRMPLVRLAVLTDRATCQNRLSRAASPLPHSHFKPRPYPTSYARPTNCKTGLTIYRKRFFFLLLYLLSEGW